MNLNKIIKTFIWILLMSIPLMYTLLWNLGNNANKLIESGEADSTSFEGLGIMSALLFCYFIYMLVFVIWLIILKRYKENVTNKWKRIQLILIFIFCVAPTLFIDGMLLRSPPNPFKQYPKKLEHGIKNGKLIRYSTDSVRLYEATVVNDKIVGKEVERYETGELKSVRNYKDGVLDGECVYYYKNGNKSESTFYEFGSSKETKAWYENGQMSYFYNPDSINRYRWWDNGQLQELYYNGYIRNFWEKDGTQTLYYGNGRVTYWYNNTKLKSSETIYKDGKIVKETTWYLNGKKSRQDEYIQLNKEESEKIDYDCEFKGFKKMTFYEEGTIKSITYWSTDEKCKNDNGNSYITYEYTIDGKLKDVHQ